MAPAVPLIRSSLPSNPWSRLIYLTFLLAAAFMTEGCFS